MSTEFLESLLAPLAEYYEHIEHEEIAINQPGEVWCRRHKPDRHGRIWVHIQDDRLDLTYLTSVCQAVANTYDQKFGPANPKLPSTVATSIPPSDHRFGAIAGMNVVYGQTMPEGGIALCIRKGAGGERSHTVQFSDWGLYEGKGLRDDLHHYRELKKKLTDPKKDALKCIQEAVQAGCNFLISGATSTGKTTFFNKIVEEMDPRTRIITVEDTREIKLHNHPNHVHLLLSRTDKDSIFTYNDAIDVIMRFTPDVVLVGEISTTNAGALWGLTGSGHGAMMTTIHADSVKNCYDKLYERIKTCIPGTERESTIQKIRENFCVIQIERDDKIGGRMITDIRIPVPRED